MAVLIAVPAAACWGGGRRSQPLLVGGEAGGLTADAGCGGERGVLMADPDTDCWGWKDLTLMAIPDTRFGGERWWLSCIGGGIGGGSHGNSQMLVVRSVEA